MVSTCGSENSTSVGVQMLEQRETLFAELGNARPLVEIDVVLEDLTLLDSESSWWPQENRRRALADGLSRRKFFGSFEECLAMSDLWMTLKPTFGIKYLHHVRMMIHEFHSYQQNKAAEHHTRVNVSA